MKEVKSPKKPLIYYYGVTLLIVLLFNLFITPLLMQQRVEEVDYGTFMQMVEEKNVGMVQVEETQILFTDKTNEKAYKTGRMDDPGLIERLYTSGADFGAVVIEPTSPIVNFLLTFILPMAVFIGLGQFLSRRMMKQMGGKDSLQFPGFGGSGAKIYVQSTEGIHFRDVAGEDEAKESLQEIVDYLYNPDLPLREHLNALRLSFEERKGRRGRAACRPPAEE